MHPSTSPSWALYGRMKGRRRQQRRKGNPNRFPGDGAMELSAFFSCHATPLPLTYCPQLPKARNHFRWARRTNAPKGTFVGARHAVAVRNARITGGSQTSATGRFQTFLGRIFLSLHGAPDGRTCGIRLQAHSERKETAHHGGVKQVFVLH